MSGQTIVKSQRDTILRPLQEISRVINRRPQVPILSNALMLVDQGRMRFIGTDLDMQLTTDVAHDIPTENATRLAIPVHKLSDILRALPEGDVAISRDTGKGGRIVLAAGSSRFKLVTLPAEEYPLMKPEADRAKFFVEAKALRQAIRTVLHAIPRDDIRQYLRGMNIAFEGNKMLVMGTDGHRLAHTEITLASVPEGVKTMIIPHKAVVEIEHALPDEGEVLITTGERQIKMNWGPVELLTKLVEGAFPAVDRMLRGSLANKNILTLGREDLLGALERAALMSAGEKTGRQIRLEIDPNGGDEVLRISANNKDAEDSLETLPASYEGVATSISFNVAYLMDAARAIGGESISLRIGEPNEAIAMTSDANEGVVMLVMPMRG